MSSVRQIYLNMYELAALAAKPAPAFPFSRTDRSINGSYCQPIANRRGIIFYPINSFLHEDPYRDGSELLYSVDQDSVFTSMYLNVENTSWRMDPDFVRIQLVDSVEDIVESSGRSRRGISVDLSDIIDDLARYDDDIELVCRRRITKRNTGFELNITIKF